MDVHTHTCYTRREIYNHVSEGKNLIKRFQLQHKVRKNPKSYSSEHLLKETMKKQIMLASNTSSFNGCLRLTYFIVTKLTIDSVHHYHDDENPLGSTPLHLPYGY